MESVQKAPRDTKAMSGIDQARAIYYDFFAGCFLYPLLEGRGALMAQQIKLLKSSPLEESLKEPFNYLEESLKTGGIGIFLKEYDDVFMIPMKGEMVLPYVSHYKEGRLNGEILAQIRQSLKALPIRRNEKSFKETEDHMGFLFLMMRYCIEEKEYVLQEQAIFNSYISPVVKEFMNEVKTHSSAKNYKYVIQILECFMAFEKEYLK
jgi:TorA maturation chaperone TorD